MVFIDSLSGAQSVADKLIQRYGRRFKQGILAEATLAQNESQEQNLCGIREQLIPKQCCPKRMLKWDVSVPLNKIVEFLDRTHSINRVQQEVAIVYAA